MATKITDLDVGELAMEVSGLKTGPGLNFDVGGLALERPGVKTATGMQNKTISTQAVLLWRAPVQNMTREAQQNEQHVCHTPGAGALPDGLLQRRACSGGPRAQNRPRVAKRNNLDEGPELKTDPGQLKRWVLTWVAHLKTCP